MTLQWIDAAARAAYGWQRYDPHDFEIAAMKDHLRAGRPRDAVQLAREIGQRWRGAPRGHLPEVGRAKRLVALFVRRIVGGGHGTAMADGSSGSSP
jgi:hypothetical protein